MCYVAAEEIEVGSGDCNMLNDERRRRLSRPLSAHCYAIQTACVLKRVNDAAGAPDSRKPIYYAENELDTLSHRSHIYHSKSHCLTTAREY